MSNTHKVAHYNRHPSGVECRTIVRHMNFNRGNAVKYIWRAGEKDPNKEIEDLEKAIDYLQDEVKLLKDKALSVPTKEPFRKFPVMLKVCFEPSTGYFFVDKNTNQTFALPGIGLSFRDKKSALDAVRSLEYIATTNEDFFVRPHP